MLMMKPLLFLWFFLVIQVSFQKYVEYATVTDKDCQKLDLDAITRLFQEHYDKCVNMSLPSCCFVPYRTESASGVYTIENTDVYCDAYGGWMTFMKRNRNLKSNKFQQSWKRYTRKKGFGIVPHDHWKGLDLLHQLTENYHTELQIELHNSKANSSQIIGYDYFHVGGPSTDYILTLGKFSGDPSLQGFTAHNNSKFSTPDHDIHTGHYRCANFYNGGWWYTECFSFLPTGVTKPVQGPGFAGFDSVEMKIRPKNCHL